MLLQRSYLLLLVCAFSAAASRGTDPNLPRARAALAQVPLHFEANQGQWNLEVRYSARSADGTLFLTEHGPVLNAGGRRVDISLLGANRTPTIEPLDRLAAKTNYFVGSRANWRAGVPEYARVAYRSVYPGIDIIYYGKKNQLEYDLVLRAGADPRAIRWKFRGADRLRLTPEGDLVVESSGARFLQKRPMLYQAAGLVEGRYTLLGHGRVGLQIEAYDRAEPLVIDPVLSYGTFLGGASTDNIAAMQIDFRGRMYVAGYTTGNDLPANFLQGGNAGTTNCFVAIVDPRFSGVRSLPTLTYLGGSRNDACTALTLDSAGNIYVTGTTTSSDFPLAGNSVQTSLNLSASSSTFTSDAFISELDPNNGLVYSTYFGGTNGETPNAITVDSKGLIYVLGTTQSTDMPVTANAYANVLWGPSDIFLLQLDPNSTSPAYATYIGGEDNDDGRGLALSPTGLVYFAASTFSTEFPLAGPVYSGNLMGVENVVIGVLDLTQSGSTSLVYSTYFGGSVSDEVRKMTLDAQGRVLITGWTLSPDFPTTAMAMKPSGSAAGNAFVVRLNPGMPPKQFVDYSTFVGGSGGDVGYDVTSDASGSIYLAGYTLSADFPVTGDAVQGQYQGGIEAFVLKFDPTVAGSAALQYGSYFGQIGVHVASALAVGTDGAIYVGGSTSQDQQATDSAFQPGYAGGYSDGFAFQVK